MKELQQVPLPCQCSSKYCCRVSAPTSTVAGSGPASTDAVSVLQRVPLSGLCSSEYRCRVRAPARTVTETVLWQL